MRCPYCFHPDTKVIDSRSKSDGKMIRRRRECLKCQRRFTTREEIDNPLILVIKSDGRREQFDREKLKKGLMIACIKRPISSDTLESIVTRVETQIRESGTEEVDAHNIGKYVMKELRYVDEVAYVRFASVYRKFDDKEEFIKELNALY